MGDYDAFKQALRCTEAQQFYGFGRVETLHVEPDNAREDPGVAASDSGNGYRVCQKHTHVGIDSFLEMSSKSDREVARSGYSKVSFSVCVV